MKPLTLGAGQLWVHMFHISLTLISFTGTYEPTIDSGRTGFGRNELIVVKKWVPNVSLLFAVLLISLTGKPSLSKWPVTIHQRSQLSYSS